MTYTLSFDPGVSTGIVLGEYGDDKPWARIAAWQIEGGLTGFLEWNRAHFLGTDGMGPVWKFFARIVDDPYLISEQFTLQSNAFVANVEPVRIEGAMVALGLNPNWQPPRAMVLAGGADAKERKKKSDQILKDGGLWLTGRDVGCKDANDAISATKHVLAYMKNTLHHEPTIAHYWPADVR